MKNRTTVAEHPEAILADLRALVTKAEGLVGELGKDSSEVESATLAERLESARQRMSEFYAGAKERVVAGAKRTDQAIKANPYTSLTIALGAGLLIGVILGRRSKE